MMFPDTNIEWTSIIMKQINPHNLTEPLFSLLQEQLSSPKYNVLLLTVLPVIEDL